MCRFEELFVHIRRIRGSEWAFWRKVLDSDATDFIVNNQIEVEWKANPSMHPVDQAQTLSHLQLICLRIGLLINCHEVQLVDGAHRIVHGQG